MTPVDQTIFATDRKRLGNCLPACVASFLDLTLEEVPHFIEHGDAMDGISRDQAMDPDLKSSAWWAMWIGFMAAHGLWPTPLDDLTHADRDEVVFVMGMSPRGVCHQVLYRNGQLCHDPHPSRAGVLDVREVLAWRPGRHDHTPTDSGPDSGSAAAPANPA